MKRNVSYVYKVSCCKVKSFFDLLQVTNNTSDDLESPQRNHQWGRSGNDGAILGQTNDDDGAVGSEESWRGLVCCSGRGSDDDAVGAVAGDLHDLGGNVLGLLEVDEDFGAELLAEVALVVAAVDGDDAHAHGAGVLDGHVTEAASCAREDDPLTRLDVGSKVYG